MCSAFVARTWLYARLQWNMFRGSSIVRQAILKASEKLNIKNIGGNRRNENITKI
jgi:hypothetical protein